MAREKVVANFGLGTSAPGNLGNNFVKPSTDYDYKNMVIRNFDSAKAIIVATAQRGFPVDYISACFFAVSGLYSMLTPLINSVSEKEGLISLMEDLEFEFEKLTSKSLKSRMIYVNKCQRLINILTPHLNKIGIDIDISQEGLWELPKKPLKNIMDE